MPRPLFRFSIRQWIVAVAAFAMVLGVGVAARNWLRAHEQVLSAHNDYLNSLVFYQEGRVTCLEVAFRSRCLMDAECGLVSSYKAISGHARRLEHLREKEAWEIAHELHGDCGSAPANLEELNRLVIEARSMPVSHQ